MAYSAPQLLVSGLKVPTFQDILDYLVQGVKTIYGNDVYLENDSMDYQLLSTYALLCYDVIACLVEDYNSHNPITATGVSLDRVASYCGIQRNSGYASTCVLKITGTAGTLIDHGSAKDVNGNIWQMETSVTIPASGYIYVDSSCQSTGAIQAPVGTITKIMTPTSGWTAVTNEVAATIGSETETDSHLRARIMYAVSKPSVSILNGIIASVENLDGVIRTKCYENPTNAYLYTVIPPHSIAMCVQGGTQSEIANVLYKKKNPGTGTYGSITQTVEVGNGLTVDISFSRPTLINPTVVVNITTLDPYVSSIADDIKANVVSSINDLEIGQTLYASSLFAPVMNAISDLTNPSFYVTSITVNNGQSLSAGLFGLITATTTNITVVATEG